MIGWDLCVPKACNDTELETLMRIGLGMANRTGLLSVCVVSIADEDRSLDWRGWLVSGLLMTVAVLGITTSIYDYFVFPYHCHMSYSKGALVAVWRSFSFYTNVLSIFNTEGTAKEGQITPIHCMRFVSMCWVIIGHSVLTFLAFGNNPADLIEAAGEVEMQLVVNAFFSVDTFFFLSGLLLTFMWFKKHAQNPRATNSLSGWALFYVHRIARLSPAYFFVIAFYTWVFPSWLTGMPALMSDDSIVSTYCERNWWTNFLYVNNIVNYKEQ
ncbi:acyltransferase, partial [Aphelenchoides avenae]